MTAVVLTDHERYAAGVVSGASKRELLTALATMPSYQRDAIRWLSRSLMAARDPDKRSVDIVSTLERQRARQRAREAYEALLALITQAGEPSELKQAMHSRLVQLWAEAEVAMGELDPPPVYPAAMTQVRDP